MRTLKYAILGLINRKPLTGYDLAKEFNSELANFWYAKHSQIYPELKKLLDEGLVEFKVVISGEVLEKKLYTITESGRKVLQKWLLKDEELKPTPKDEFKLRMYFSENMTKEELSDKFKIQLLKRRKKLQVLEEKMSEFTSVPNIHSSEFGDYIVLRGAITREKAYVDWLNECLGYVK